MTDGISHDDIADLFAAIRNCSDLVENGSAYVMDTLGDVKEQLQTLQAETEKVQDVLRHFSKRLTDIEFAIHRLSNPAKKPRPTHDGDLVGGDF